MKFQQEVKRHQEEHRLIWLKSKKMPKDIRQNTCNQELKRVLNVIKNLLSTAITKIRYIVQSNVYPNPEKTKRQNIIVNHAAGK